jgi:hypothetical protein
MHCTPRDIGWRFALFGSMSPLIHSLASIVGIVVHPRAVVRARVLRSGNFDRGKRREYGDEW